jgi:hypothetical protein
MSNRANIVFKCPHCGMGFATSPNHYVARCMRDMDPKAPSSNKFWQTLGLEWIG